MTALNEFKFAFFSAQKSITLTASILGNAKAADIIRGRTTYNLSALSRTQFIGLTKFVKPYFKGLTQAKMNILFKEIKNNPKKKYVSKGTGDRLFPLSSAKYREFAKYVYNKRGSPKFNKYIITGVVFGQPYTSTAGYGFSTVIVERAVGVYIRGCCLHMTIES
jgi:hypothetical protein